MEWWQIYSCLSIVFRADSHLQSRLFNLAGVVTDSGFDFALVVSFVHGHGVALFGRVDRVVHGDVLTRTRAHVGPVFGRAGILAGARARTRRRPARFALVPTLVVYAVAQCRE